MMKKLNSTRTLFACAISVMLFYAGPIAAKDMEKEGGMACEKPMGGMGKSGGMGGMGGMGGEGGGMSMMGMMGNSKMGCMATSDTLDVLLKTVQDARKSKDKAKMAAALATVETHIGVMKGHMEKCKGMMGMMGMMMDGDGMKGMQGMKPAPDAPVSGSKQDPAEHEKHHPK
ncbi:MAG: hypothetical protein ABIW76_17885 [Fibrobacteria bacterium]